MKREDRDFTHHDPVYDHKVMFLFVLILYGGGVTVSFWCWRWDRSNIGYLRRPLVYPWVLEFWCWGLSYKGKEWEEIDRWSEHLPRFSFMV